MLLGAEEGLAIPFCEDEGEVYSEREGPRRFKGKLAS